MTQYKFKQLSNLIPDALSNIELNLALSSTELYKNKTQANIDHAYNCLNTQMSKVKHYQDAISDPDRIKELVDKQNVRIIAITDVISKLNYRLNQIVALQKSFISIINTRAELGTINMLHDGLQI